MKKRGILIVIVFIILIAGGFAYYNFGKKEVCFEDQCFDVEVAETESERSRGLMYRESLEEDRGMFFVFDESKKHGFWMKNTEIPLDIMWINSEMEVVHI